MPIRSATVSVLGSSMVRVSLEEDGESLLASLIASMFDCISITVLGVVGLPGVAAVGGLVPMDDPRSRPEAVAL